eukprot:TRINITY_DN5297_c0_g2_i1.p1 TRINITY_DN5297_c0_g2~~TRINITY_DN5297_c0_g2_i1.p1  ORF type:complete len:365 (+),score=29.02 TRINITY_DN5297_c0_g2_i1:86-1180(+)
MFQDDTFTDMEVDFERALPRDQATKRNICFDYQSGNCTRGNTCPYKHSFTNRSKMEDEVCKYWLRGLCKMGSDCIYMHEYILPKIPECFYYQRFGECSNPECVFRHVSLDDKIPECAAYRRGFCRYGPRCRLKHIKREACPNYMAGLCIEGTKCKLGHPTLKYVTEDEIKARLAKGEGIEEAGVDPMPPQPATGIICHKCGEPGHIAPECTQVGGMTRIQRTMIEVMQVVQEPCGVGCYHCAEEDHLSHECPKKRERYMQNREGLANARGDVNLEERQRPRCFRCGEEGHVNRDCPLVLAERAKGLIPNMGSRPIPGVPTRQPTAPSSSSSILGDTTAMPSYHASPFTPPAYNPSNIPAPPGMR